MPDSPLKSLGRKASSYWIGHFPHRLNGAALRKSAMVFAPHQDDETLGCGGTIVKKRRAGARVHIVFLTDGGKSHSHLISKDELKAMRAREALAASGVLGVEEREISFLEFEDSDLERQRDAAVAKVKELLMRERPEEVFIPYSKDAQGDHKAANRIVRAALARCRRPAVVYEYPVWFWTHWPWANLPIGSRREILRQMRNTMVSAWGLLWNFRWAVDVGDVLEVKREALDQYKSQMTRLIPDSRWRTLSDVADGAFLECFFQNYEIFHRYSYPSPIRTAEG